MLTYSTNSSFDDGLQFLLPGSVEHNHLTSNVVPIYFTHPIIIFAGICNCYPPLPPDASVVFNFVKNYISTPTQTPPFLSMTLDNTISHTSNTSVSSTIDTSDNFSVYVTTTNVPKHTYLFCNASTY